MHLDGLDTSRAPVGLGVCAGVIWGDADVDVNLWVPVVAGAVGGLVPVLGSYLMARWQRGTDREVRATESLERAAARRAELRAEARSQLAAGSGAIARWVGADPAEQAAAILELQAAAVKLSAAAEILADHADSAAARDAAARLSRRAMEVAGTKVVGASRAAMWDGRVAPVYELDPSPSVAHLLDILLKFH